MERPEQRNALRDMLRKDLETHDAQIAPAAICDDCIANRLDLNARQRSNHKTRGLADVPGFDRCRDACSVCGSVKLVIRRT